MSIKITDEGLERRKKESLEEMVKKFEEEAPTKSEAVKNVKKSFIELKRSCEGLPKEQGGVECFVIAKDAENEWERKMREYL